MEAEQEVARAREWGEKSRVWTEAKQLQNSQRFRGRDTWTDMGSLRACVCVSVCV